MATIGNRIKEIRKNFGLTQKELSEETNIDPATIRKYENGQMKHPKMDTLQKIADGLNIDVNILLDSEVDTVRSMQRIMQAFNEYGGAILTGEEIKNQIDNDTNAPSEDRLSPSEKVYVSFDSLHDLFVTWHTRYSEYLNVINNPNSTEEEKKEAEISIKRFVDTYPMEEPNKYSLEAHKKIGERRDIIISNNED